MLPLHDRMPAILFPDEFAPWLSPELTDPDQLLPMLDQYPEEEITEHSVSPLIGSPTP